MTREEFEEHLRKLAEPIDFDSLQRRGLLLKQGAWFRVPNLHRLPDHAAFQIREMETSADGVRVKFAGAVHRRRAARLLKKVGKTI